MEIITELKEYEKLAQRTASTNEHVNKEILSDRLKLDKTPDIMLEFLNNLINICIYGDLATMMKSTLFYGVDKDSKFNPKDFYTYTDDVDHYNSILSGLKERLLNLNPKIIHAMLGLVSEAAEFTEHVISHILKGEPLDVDHLTKELGDSSWFVVEGAVGIGANLQNVAETNIDKLKKRFPGKFTTQDAVERKDEQ